LRREGDDVTAITLKGVEEPVEVRSVDWR